MTFLSNPVFLSALFSWLLAQLLKTIIDLFNRRRIQGLIIETLLWKTGGMPSSHSALVTGLAVSIALKNGLKSELFALSAFYGILVIRDAMGVRRSSGLQARSLNSLGAAVREAGIGEFEPVKEIHGHTPLEVAVGILIGLAISLLVGFLVPA